MEVAMKSRTIYMEAHEKKNYERKSKEILRKIEDRITVSKDNIIEIKESSELIESISKIQEELKRGKLV